MCVFARGVSDSGGVRRCDGTITLMPSMNSSRALAERQRHAFDHHVRAVIVEIVAGHVLHAAADALADPVILVGAEQMAVALEHFLAQRDHLLGPMPGSMRRYFSER